MSRSETQWLSIAGAAGEAGLPVWAIRAFVRCGRLHVVEVKGMPRIRAVELRAFLRINRPQETTP